MPRVIPLASRDVGGEEHDRWSDFKDVRPHRLESVSGMRNRGPRRRLGQLFGTLLFGGNAFLEML